jgi:DNA-binding PadR family transcriptional regulator
MSIVFSHGRLRLYLLKLLADGPRHGYVLIRQLEDRFRGLYAPSAGTVYPRLQRLEAEGLVTHTAAGGRKTYEITEAGREELRRRAREVVALESDIRALVADLASLANEIQNEVRDSVRDLRRGLREAAGQSPHGRWAPPSREKPTGPPPYVANDASVEFDRRLTAFVEEVSELVRRAGLSDAQLRHASRALDLALDGLRRILR